MTAVQAWLAAAGISQGRLFRRIDRHGRIDAALTDQSVGLIVKPRVAQIGLDASAYATNSLRAGLATSAANYGVEEHIIARTTRHKSISVLRSYICEGEVFRGNASGRIGL